MDRQLKVAIRYAVQTNNKKTEITEQILLKSYES